MPGSHDWRNRAASQIAQPLPDKTADAFTLLNPRAVSRRMWSNGEYERALDFLDRAVATGRGHREWILNDNDLAPLRDRPRFRQILARLE